MAEEEKLSPLAEARKKKSERDAKLSEEADAFELLSLQLDEKFSSEIGRRKVDYVIYSQHRMLFAVKRAHALEKSAWDDYAAKQGRAQKAVELNAVVNFVQACLLHPTVPEFKKLVFGTEGHPGAEGYAHAALLEIQKLHGQALIEESEKL